jgi:hypothetical protein
MRYLIAVAAIALAACSSAPVQVPRDLVAPQRSISPLSSGSDIRQEFISVLHGCQQVLVGFEQQSLEAKRWSLGMHITGAIAGAMAPFVGGGSTILALAAIAGTMNTMPALVERDGLGATTILASRESVRAAMQAGAGKYYAALGDGDKKLAVVAIDEMRAACVAYLVTAPGAPGVIGE